MSKRLNALNLRAVAHPANTQVVAEAVVAAVEAVEAVLDAGQAVDTVDKAAMTQAEVEHLAEDPVVHPPSVAALLALQPSRSRTQRLIASVVATSGPATSSPRLTLPSGKPVCNGREVTSSSVANLHDGAGLPGLILVNRWHRPVAKLPFPHRSRSRIFLPRPA